MFYFALAGRYLVSARLNPSGLAALLVSGNMRRDDIRNLAIIAHVDHFTREEGGNPEDPRFIFVDHPILFAILLRRSWAITAMMIFHLDG